MRARIALFTFKRFTLVAALTAASAAFAAPSATFQGRLAKPDGTALQGQHTLLRIQIRSSGAEDCILWDETQEKDLRDKKGLFTVSLNDGTGTRNDSANTTTFSQVFTNGKQFSIDGAFCAAGSGTITFTPGASDERKIAFYFKDETMATWESMPYSMLTHSAYALEASQVGGYPASSLLRVENGSGPQAAPALSPADFTELLALVGGTSSQYARANSAAGTQVSVVSGSPASPASGALWFDSSSHALKFYDGTSNQTVGTSGGSVSSITAGTGLDGGTITTTGTIALADSGATAATYGAAGKVPVLAVDAKGRITSASEANITVGLSGLKSSVSPYPSLIDMTTPCTAATTLVYSSVTDRFTCTAITAAWQDGGSGKIYYSGGNVGIGTTMPGASLDIGGFGADPLGYSPNYRMALKDNFDGVTGLEMRNSSATGTLADIRVALFDSDGAYLATAQPGLGNTNLLLGVARNTASFVFTNAAAPGVQRHLAIGTIGAKDVILSTNNAEKARLTSAGYLGIGTNSPNATLDVRSGTITTAVPGISVAQTWNNGATTFTGLNVNVTNTASASASSLFNLALGGSSIFSVDTSANILTSSSLIRTSASYLVLGSGNSMKAAVTSGGFYVRSDNALGFSSATTPYSTGDTLFYRDAAGVFAQRNGTSAQQLSIYNTYTSATNFERAEIGWQANSNVFTVGTTAGSGGGTVRNIAMVGGYVGIGTTTVSNPLTVKKDLGVASAENHIASFTRDGGTGAGVSLGYRASASAESAGFIRSTGALPFVLGTSGVQNVLTLYNTGTSFFNGSVGIGTATPGTPLDVKANAGGSGLNVIGTAGNVLFQSGGINGAGILSQSNSSTNGFVLGTDAASSNAGAYLRLQTKGVERVTVDNAGKVGIGTTTPDQALHVVGNVHVQGSTDCTLGNGAGGTNCSSDARLKRNVSEIENPLAKILSLRGVEFEWNERSRSPGRRDIGVIAQDVEKVFPTAVIEDPASGYKKVDYAVLVAPVIEAFKEQTREMASLKLELDQKSKELEALKGYLCEKDPGAPICR